MCFYQPNKHSCACTYLQLIRPCKEATLYRAPATSSLSVSPGTDTYFDTAVAASLSQSRKKSRGILVKPCANRYITHEAGERECSRCCGENSPMSSTTATNAFSGSEMEVDDDGGDDIPFHTPYHQQLQKQKQKQKKKRFMPILVSMHPDKLVGSADTPRITKRLRIFKREPLSSPVMRLRGKWKENVGKSLSQASFLRVVPVPLPVSGNGSEAGAGAGFGDGFGGVPLLGTWAGNAGWERALPRGNMARRFYRGMEMQVKYDGFT